MKTAKQQTNEYLQDIITSQQRVAELNASESKRDVWVETLACIMLVCVLGTALGLLYWYQENDGTDTGVGCIEDCLDPEVRTCNTTKT